MVSTSPTVPPSTLTSALPPVSRRRGPGTRTVVVIEGRVYGGSPLRAPRGRACLGHGALATRAHASRRAQLIDTAKVGIGPVAPGASRSETDHVAGLVDAAQHAVDPAVAQRRIDRIRIGDARAFEALLPEAHPELGGGGVRLEPGREILRGQKELRPRRRRRGHGAGSSSTTRGLFSTRVWAPAARSSKTSWDHDSMLR